MRKTGGRVSQAVEGLCKDPGIGIQRPLRLELNEGLRVVQMLMTGKVSNVY